MIRRALFLGLLLSVACSRSAENSGIILDVDADGSVAKAAINQLVVTVNGKKQTWTGYRGVFACRRRKICYRRFCG
jgi:hypothetical protein